MQGADGKKISYASRKAIVYDDHNSECSDSNDRDAVYEELVDDELKPNSQFDNYKKQFESLMKHKQVPTLYPIVSCIITYDSTKTILVSKKDDTEFWVRMYDLESYDKTFEEMIGGRPECFIRTKEVE